MKNKNTKASPIDEKIHSLLPVPFQLFTKLPPNDQVVFFPFGKSKKHKTNMYEFAPFYKPISNLF